MNETVQTMSSRPLKDVIATLIGAIPDLTPEEAESIIGNKGPFVKSIRNVFHEQLKSTNRVWKTVTVGELSREDILAQLSTRKYRTQTLAKELVECPEFYVSADVVKLKLCLVSVKDLGFKEEPNISQIYDCIGKFKFALCPPEVGPLLLMSPLETNRRLYIAMNPISNRNGKRIFLLEFPPLGNKCNWLGSEPADEEVDKLWMLDSKFVFVLNK